MANRWGNNGNNDRLFFRALKSLQLVTATMKLKDACFWKKGYDQTRQHIKKQTRYFSNKGPSSQGYDFSSSHVWMWKLHYKESWALNNWCFWTLVLEKTLESPLDFNEIKPINPKGILNIHWKDWCWNWNSSTLATWCKELTHWKRPWFWERLKAGGEEDGRGWDGWMASLTRWTWIWASSESWWQTGKPDVLLHGVTKSWSWLSDWTELMTYFT